MEPTSAAGAVIFDILKSALEDRDTSWSVGTFGALAEFFHDPVTPSEIRVSATRLVAATAQGAIAIDRSEDMRLLPYEGLSSVPTAWTQGVLVCLPKAKSTCHNRFGIAEVGTDENPLNGSPPGDVLFDLGLGINHLDAHIRTNDPALIAVLRSHLNSSLFDTDVALLAAIKAANPSRVFATKIARIEVYQEIPDDHEVTPLGPHTHLSERLLKRRKTQAATLPVPDDWVPLLAFYPSHPVRDKAGGLRTFDRHAFDHFQSLLAAHGPNDLNQVKQTFRQAMANISEPADKPSPTTKFQRTALRIAIRQYVHEHGSSDLLSRWRAVYEPAERP